MDFSFIKLSTIVFQNKKTKLIVTASYLLLLTITLFIGGCGEDAKVNQDTSRFTTIYNNILKPNCGTCHYPGGRASDPNYRIQLDFSNKDNAYHGLTTYNSLDPASAGTLCAEIPYVTPRDLNHSLVLTKISRTYVVPNYGKSGCVPTNTHLEGLRITESEVNLFIDWINDGAGR